VSIYRKPKSPYWHFDFQRNGYRFHGSTGCTSKRDAQRYEDEQRRRAALGVSAKPSITVDEACGLWWTGKGTHLKSHATARYQLDNIIAGLGKNRLLGDVAFLDADRMVARRRAAVSDSSVNRETQLARRVFRHAADRGFDVAGIEWGKLMLREPKERIRELSADEEKRLFEKLPADLAAVVEFALLSGQRRTSIITLLWSKVDLGGARAAVRVKGGHWHTFPLTPRMVAILANRPKVAPQVFTYVCARPAPPRPDRPRRLKGVRYPFSLQGWTRQWRAALVDAGIEDFRFHDLRHTTGTRLLRATGNMKTVQKLLGHADVTTSARYAHAMEDDVRNGMLAAESRTIPEPAAPEIKKKPLRSVR
jgi:integrase